MLNTGSGQVVVFCMVGYIYIYIYIWLQTARYLLFRGVSCVGGGRKSRLVIGMLMLILAILMSPMFLHSHAASQWQAGCVLLASFFFAVCAG